MSANPFPGMNPYLENCRFWHDVRHELIRAIRAQVREQLPSGFVARIAEHDFSETIWEPYIEIASMTEPGQIVTIIEVLSPANKRPCPGTEDYHRKQKQILRSETHLLEIDLLREGNHMVAAPLPSLAETGAGWDYLISLHRAGWGAEYDTWPIRLRDRLPRVPVPLAAGHRDIPLDLQAALERTWDAGGYGDSIDYAADPEPPLSPPDAAWIDTLLRQQGLRT